MARPKILEKAIEVAENEGPLGLTLDRVAEQAGVSKGGLLYHFPTKEALVRSMIDLLLEQHEAKLSARVDKGQRYSRAMLDLELESLGSSSNLFAALIAAIVIDRTVAARTEPFFRSRIEKLVEDDIPLPQAMVFVLALDGLFMNMAVGTVSLESEELDLLRDGLEHLLGFNDA